MAREGLRYVIIPILLAVIPLVFGYWPISILLICVAAFMAFFFRDPQRIAPTEPNIIVSPADGRVTRVRLLAPDQEDSGTLISIFMSPWNVHINRSPVAGRITKVIFKTGRFVTAMREDSSLVNEQNALTIEGPDVTVVCKQVAGVLARRIVCWKRVGDQLSLGERFGLIKFSSRTDLILPPEVEVVVREGMRVRGGSTIIGRILR
jgi:phosphatidylserine decarboxylase